jgi:hypothetical protein
MLRMTMTTPNVMKKNRPPWLTAFNFSLRPLISENFGCPGGYNSDNFNLIAPFRSNLKEWRSLKRFGEQWNRRAKSSTVRM